ncbi:hypothetical protein [Micromonospora sp. WMMD1082]|uniref:hypothetical protein n=1 Tax=Micromonospora sp. WMMD1082 TaxID=3016104 RepID=UPI00241705D0|nr:hypothetical protein [Micromonospora sp. WMMD1082]MDG4795520.1 hypothetical protein [Micromonospora sp. WMMD1082]
MTLGEQLLLFDHLRYVIVVRPTEYGDPVPAFAYSPFATNADGSPVVPPERGFVRLDLLVMDLAAAELRCAFAVSAVPTPRSPPGSTSRSTGRSTGIWPGMPGRPW